MKWDDIISVAVRSYIRIFIENTSFIRILVVLNIRFIRTFMPDIIEMNKRRRKKCTRQKSHLSQEAKTFVECIIPRLDAWCACAWTPSAKDEKRFHSFVNGCEHTQFQMETFHEWTSESALNEWMNEPQKSEEPNRFCYEFNGMHDFSVANNAIACLRINGWKMYTGKSAIFIFILCAHHIFPGNFPCHCPFIWHFGCVPNNNMLHAKLKTGYTKSGDLFE